MKIQMTIYAMYNGENVDIRFYYNDRVMGSDKANRIYWAFLNTNPSFHRRKPENGSIKVHATSANVCESLPKMTWSKRGGLKGNYQILVKPKNLQNAL